MNKLFSTCILALFLTSCTSNGLMFRSWGNYNADTENDDLIVYKIGAPYKVNGVTYSPVENYSYNETGMASWYMTPASKVTANGERGDPYMSTASHKTLPLPSIVKITNLENGQSAVVRVNDRGPFVNNRLIDVSEAAAQELGFQLQGTTLVRVEILPEESKKLKSELHGDKFVEETTTSVEIKPVATSELKPLYEPEETFLKPIYSPETPPASEPEIQPTGSYYIQYGAFKNPDNAMNLKDKIDSSTPALVVETDTLYKVRSGPYATHEIAKTTLDKMKSEGYSDISIVTE